ncbi:MAG: hypothetical protein ACE5J2_01560 [Nitrososphaerales archaeon]
MRNTGFKYRKEKKGVAGIIGGIFLAAILFSSVAIFFFTIVEGENTRSKAEIKAQSYKNEKLKENFEIQSLAKLSKNDHIEIHVNNTGAIPMTASYLMVYDANSIPILQGTPLIGGNPLTINAGLGVEIDTGDIDSDIKFLSDPPEPYRIDIISERGNIQSTTYPPPAIIPPEQLEDALKQTIEEIDINKFVVEDVLAQNTGSIILNYTLLGVMFPDQITRDGIDQTGWEIEHKGIPGYPAFRLPADEETNLIVRVKNRDPSGMDMNLMHHTGMVLTMSGGASFGQTTAYICSLDLANPTVKVKQYDDSLPIVLPNVYGEPDPEKGWVNLTFCDLDPKIGTFDPRWKPNTSDMTFFFMVIRGQMENGEPYAQTIPYQAVLVTDTISDTGSAFYACIKSDTSNNCSTSAGEKYQGSPGESVYVRVQTSDPHPYTADWIYPDGKFKRLGEIISGDTLSVKIPNNAEPGKYYMIQASDGEGNIHYMTFYVKI